MLRRRTALSTTLAQGSTMLSQGPTCGLRPALGTGHRLGIQNAPAGGPSQITDHPPHSIYMIVLVPTAWHPVGRAQAVICDL